MTTEFLPTEAMDQLMALVEQLEPMDEASYEQFNQQLKKMKKQWAKPVMRHEASIKSNAKLSKRHKKQLYKLAKQLIKLVKDPKVSEAIKFEALEMVKQITSYLDVADERDKHFLSTHIKQVIGFSSATLVVLSALYGAKINKK